MDKLEQLCICKEIGYILKGEYILITIQNENNRRR